MRLLRRLLPHPILTLLLTLAWVLLTSTWTLNSLVFGFLLGFLIPFLTQPYWPHQMRLKKPLKIIEYILIVLYDIVNSG